MGTLHSFQVFKELLRNLYTNLLKSYLGSIWYFKNYDCLRGWVEMFLIDRPANSHDSFAFGFKVIVLF